MPARRPEVGQDVVKLREIFGNICSKISGRNISSKNMSKQNVVIQRNNKDKKDAKLKNNRDKWQGKLVSLTVI